MIYDIKELINTVEVQIKGSCDMHNQYPTIPWMQYTVCEKTTTNVSYLPLINMSPADHPHSNDNQLTNDLQIYR